MAKQNIAKAIKPIPKVLFEGAFRHLFTDVQLDCCKKLSPNFIINAYWCAVYM